MMFLENCQLEKFNWSNFFFMVKVSVFMFELVVLTLKSVLLVNFNHLLEGLTMIFFLTLKSFLLVNFQPFTWRANFDYFSRYPLLFLMMVPGNDFISSCSISQWYCTLFILHECLISQNCLIYFNSQRSC